MVSRLCGCASAQCNCVVEAGDGIDVTGTGSPANPYVVSAQDVALTGRLQVQDTSTVDLTLTGEGTLNNPWVLSANASLTLGDLTDVNTSDQTPGYVLSRNVNGTFEMVPAPTAPPGTIITDNSIDGDGSLGDPLTVHDYDRIAWLSGADNLPNIGQMRMGETTSTFNSAYWIGRQVQSTQPCGPSSNVPVEASMGIVNTSVPTDQFGANLSAYQIHLDNPNHNKTVDWRFTDRGYVQKQIGTTEFVDPLFTFGGRVNVTGNGTDSAFVDVTFPAHIPNLVPAPGVPIIIANFSRSGTSSVVYTVNVQNASRTGCRFRIFRTDGGNFNATFQINYIVFAMNHGSVIC